MFGVFWLGFLAWAYILSVKTPTYVLAWTRQPKRILVCVSSFAFWVLNTLEQDIVFDWCTGRRCRDRHHPITLYLVYQLVHCFKYHMVQVIIEHYTYLLHYQYTSAWCLVNIDRCTGRPGGVSGYLRAWYRSVSWVRAPPSAYSYINSLGLFLVDK